MTQTLQIIVPTRNRAELAAAAVRSALQAGAPPVRIMVSDNSTQSDEAERLAAYCADTSATYIRPAQPLAMAAHWEWALGQTLASSPATHVAFLTDRMVFQAGGLRAVAEAMHRWPAKVISFAHDRVNDYRTPVELEQSAWSGRVLEVPSELFVSDWSTARLATGMAMPRLLNSIVPRSVFDRVRARFGTVCGNATSPDFAFAFRTLAVVDSILFYDRPALLHYALGRSNGASVERGIESQDHAEFVRDLDGSNLLPDAPLPGALTVLNAIMQEYCAVRSKAMWPPVELAAYLDAVEREATQMEAGRRKWELLERIRGLREMTTRPTPPRAVGFERLPTPWRTRSPRHLAHRLWLKIRRAWPLSAGHDRIHPPVLVTVWGSSDLALQFAGISPRRPHPLMSNLELAVGPGADRGALRKVGVIR